MNEYKIINVRIFKLMLFLVFFGAWLPAYAQREVVPFDDNWAFTLGDPSGAEAPEFDDRSWRILNVPHDWAFEADYVETAAQGAKGGYKPGGIGWYRKNFNLPSNWKDKNIEVHFDGVFMNSDVWVNGIHLGKWPYGYNSFQYDLTEHLNPGKNCLVVRVDSRLEPATRWYHGCGIYGHVNLRVTSPVHIETDGIFVYTPVVTDEKADVMVETELANTDRKNVRVLLETVLLNSDGAQVATGSEEISLKSGERTCIKQLLSIRQPQRWDTENPNLYEAISTISQADRVVDQVGTHFGIRTVRWDAQTGFWLNGRSLKLRGVCDHLEAGPVGAASPDELLRRKIELLKNMGCNAIRTAHNPQVPLFYDICDELGVLVMDEVFDGWRKKASADYGMQAFDQWWERDLRAWLKRDRNHPSVVVWSLGNETRGDIGEELIRVCHELDPTRRVTSGHAGSEFMDIKGENGGSERQDSIAEAALLRDKPFVSTEAPHTWQVRGYYRTKTWWRFMDVAPEIIPGKGPYACPDLTEKEIFTYDWTKPAERKNKKQTFTSSYDNAMVRITARKNWELVRDLPWYSGSFRWTGIDYLGEAGYVHGGWPFRAFMGGAIDLALFPKDLYYFYQSQWTETPMVHTLPHWTHPRMKLGTEIPVWVYSNCDEVELFLNGESLGKDQPGAAWNEMQCEWLVPWTPGILEAVGYKAGQEVVRASHATAGVPAKLKMEVEGNKCPVITVTATDDKGVMNPYAENRIHYHINGPARILSLESGNPVNVENNYGQTSRATFFGLGRAFLRTTADTGDISVVVGAICGEKQLMTSNRIAIDVRSIAVRGDAPKHTFKIRYSLDGSKPNLNYSGAFEVKPGTTVKADVFDGDTLLFSLSERFAPDEGIYWYTEEDLEAMARISEAVQGGDQAEDATLKDAQIASEIKRYHGKGYAVLSQKGSFVEWYQENDGNAREAQVSIRYSGKQEAGLEPVMRFSNNGKISGGKLKLRSSKKWKNIEIPIKLERGANALRLTLVGDGVVNIDEIIVK